MNTPPASDTKGSVVRIVTRLNVGGPARHVLILSRSLPARGYKSDLVVGSPGPREGELTDPRVPLNRVTTLRREVNISRDLSSFRFLMSLLEKQRPSIVHTHMAKAGALGRLAASRVGVPNIVHTFHGHVLEGYFSGPKNSLFIKLERSLAKRTKALVAVSEAIRNDLFDLGIGTDRQWHVIPLGLDLDELLTDSPDPGSARAVLGLPSEGPVVAIVGRLVPIKDHSLFIEAAVFLAKQFANITFVIAGDGEWRSHLERQAREALGDRVRFLGWVDDLKTLYAAVDVVVLTSRNEGTPVTLIEASAAGRPVVATDVGGVSDVVVDGATGFVVPPGDPIQVSEAIRRLLRDPQLRGDFGRTGRAHVAARFSSARLVDDVAALYDELLSVPSNA